MLISLVLVAHLLELQEIQEELLISITVLFWRWADKAEDGARLTGTTLVELVLLEAHLHHVLEV
jgi:hypothetical protein